MAGERVDPRDRAGIRAEPLSPLATTLPAIVHRPLVVPLPQTSMAAVSPTAISAGATILAIRTPDAGTAHTAVTAAAIASRFMFCQPGDAGHAFPRCRQLCPPRQEPATEKQKDRDPQQIAAPLRSRLTALAVTLDSVIGLSRSGYRMPAPRTSLLPGPQSQGSACSALLKMRRRLPPMRSITPGLAARCNQRKIGKRKGPRPVMDRGPSLLSASGPGRHPTESCNRLTGCDDGRRTGRRGPAGPSSSAPEQP